MNKKKNNKKILQVDTAKKMLFGLREDQPVQVIHHYFTDKQKTQYDMHYGLELGILLKGKMRRHYRDFQTNILSGQVWLCGMWEPHGWQVAKSPCEAIVLIIFPPMLARTHFENVQNINWLNPFNVSPANSPQIENINRKTRRDSGNSFKKVFSNP